MDRYGAGRSLVMVVVALVIALVLAPVVRSITGELSRFSGCFAGSLPARHQAAPGCMQASAGPRTPAR